MSSALFEKEHRAIGSFPYIELVNENLNFIPHYHDELELIYVERGSIRAFSASKGMTLCEGDICFFMPCEIHSFQTVMPNNAYVIKLNPYSYVENIDFEQIRLNCNCLSPGDAEYHYFKALIDELREEYTEQSLGYEFAIRHCKNQIILALLRKLPHETVDHKRDGRLLDDVNHYLEDHYDQRIDLEELARVCHFSKFYFAHRLKEMSGMSFVEYLTVFRLDKAIPLLTEDRISITEIAHRCGFSNLRTFNRVFRMSYSMTPTEYRKKIRATGK